MTGRAVRWGVALAFGGLWWWGLLRLVLAPDAGVLEGAVATGGWGLSLLPVHCVPKARATGRTDGGNPGGGGGWASAVRRPDEGETGRRTAGGEDPRPTAGR
jgi:hypothetical protein